MAKKQEKEIERWVTVNGARVPIFKDGSVGGPKALRDKIKASQGKKSTDKKETESFVVDFDIQKAIDKKEAKRAKSHEAYMKKKQRNIEAAKKAFEAGEDTPRSKAEAKALLDKYTDKKSGSKERLSVYERQLAEVNDELANAPKSKALRNEEGIRELEKKKAQLEGYIAKEKGTEKSGGKKSFHENTAADGTPIVTEYTNLKDVQDAGYKIVDSQTWKPVSGLSEKEVRRKFENGEIDFIKKADKKSSNSTKKNKTVEENTHENRQKLKKQIDDYTAAHRNPTPEDRRIVKQMRDKYNAMVKESMDKSKAKANAAIEAKRKKEAQEKELNDLKQEHFKLYKHDEDDIPGRDAKLNALEKQIKEKEDQLSKNETVEQAMDRLQKESRAKVDSMSAQQVMKYAKENGLRGLKTDTLAQRDDRVANHMYMQEMKKWREQKNVAENEALKEKQIAQNKVQRDERNGKSENLKELINNAKDGDKIKVERFSSISGKPTGEMIEYTLHNGEWSSKGYGSFKNDITSDGFPMKNSVKGIVPRIEKVENNQVSDRVKSYQDKFLKKKSVKEIKEIQSNIEKAGTNFGYTESDMVAMRAIENELKERKRK